MNAAKLHNNMLKKVKKKNKQEPSSLPSIDSLDNIANIIIERILEERAKKEVV